MLTRLASSLGGGLRARAPLAIAVRHSGHGQPPPEPLQGPGGRPVEAHRGALIMLDMVGVTFLVHNGKELRRVKPTTQMVGHKFGEFVRTKIPPRHKVKKQGQQKGGRKT